MQLQGIIFHVYSGSLLFGVSMLQIIKDCLTDNLNLIISHFKILGRYTYILPCTPHTTLECLQQLLKGALRVGCFFYLDNVNMMSSQILSLFGHLLEEIHQSFSKLNLDVSVFFLYLFNAGL